MRLASFDIFDTALIRKCGKPENIFYLLAHRLYPDDMAKREDFLLWRLRAESKFRSRYDWREPSLSDIYTDDDLYGFNEYTPDEMAACEKHIELENLIANPAIRELIAQKREEGYIICFISDMYLSALFLTSVLRRERCLMGDEQVYVSCELQVRKSSGLMFQHLKVRLQPDEWVHYGDNRHSDVKMAKRAGLKAVWVDTRYTDVEQRVIDGAERLRDRYSLSILAGYSRMARFVEGGTPEAVLATDFVAPAYIPYVLFILKKAREQRIKRLYFLSRDSYILLKAVQALFPKDIELNYLFVSRQSLLLPYLAEPTAEHFLEVMDHKTVYRKHVDILLHKLGTDRKELQEIDISFDYNHIVTREQEQDFLHKIFDGAFVSILRQRAQEKRQTLLVYFEQEGLFDGTENAMVDIGWLGTSRLMINQIFRDTGHCETLFFYCGIRNDVLPTKYGRYISYFPAGQLSTESTALLENYFSASPYPTTIGYRQDGGRIIPVFPTGISYADTPIIRANIGAIERLIPAVASLRFITEETLYEWARLSLTTIISLQAEMVLSLVAQCYGFGEEPLARRLTFTELCILILTGRHITALDRMSVYMTCGKRFSFPLLKCYEIIHKVKSYIFRKYIYK